MKLSKEELISKIDGLEISDEIKISLMEDVSDSMDVVPDNNSEIEELKAKYDELIEKYKSRFLSGEEVKEEVEEKDEDSEELKEEEVIDIKEI